MFAQYTGEPTIRASAENRSWPATSLTRFKTTVVPGTDFAPSATPWAIFAVLPESEWYAIRTLTPEGVSAASEGWTESARRQRMKNEGHGFDTRRLLRRSVPAGVFIHLLF